MNRRQFIRATFGAGALAASFPYISRGRVLGANDRIGIGFIGVGERGATHVAVVQKLIASGENAQIVSVTDAYRYRLNEVAKASGAKACARADEIIGDGAVDAVCLATPDRLHMIQGLKALRAGKDIYCEKPMSHWSQFDLARTFCDEMEKRGRIVQIGDQGNSSPGWAKLAEAYRAGAIGRLLTLEAGYYRDGDFAERMSIPDPEAKPGSDLDWVGFEADAPRRKFKTERFFCWRRYLDYGGGPCTDLLPHTFMPFVCALNLGFPERAAATGGLFKYTAYERDVPDVLNANFVYPEKYAVSLHATETNGHVSEPVIRGDEGTITLQNAGAWESGFDSFTVLPNKGAPKVVSGMCGDPTPEHWRNFLKCVRTRERPVSDAREFLKVQAALSMAMLAWQRGQVARFDAVKRCITFGSS